MKSISLCTLVPGMTPLCGLHLLVLFIVLRSFYLNTLVFPFHQEKESQPQENVCSKMIPDGPSMATSSPLLNSPETPWIIVLTSEIKASQTVKQADRIKHFRYLRQDYSTGHRLEIN